MDIEDQRTKGRQILKEVFGVAYLERRDAPTNTSTAAAAVPETYAFGESGAPRPPRKGAACCAWRC